MRSTLLLAAGLLLTASSGCGVETSDQLLENIDVDLSDCQAVTWPSDIGRVTVTNSNDERVKVKVLVAIYDADDVKLGDTTVRIALNGGTTGRKDFSVAAGNQEELARCEIEKMEADVVE